MNSQFKGKEILLLSPSFYGYEKEIVQKIKELGGSVTYLNNDPTELFGTLIGIFELLGLPRQYGIRVFECFLYRKISHRKFDIILVISGWAVTSNITSKIRNNNLTLGGRMVLYYWDSLKRLKDDVKRWRDFDKVCTFDKEDYLNNKSRMLFLPLFYCDKYWKIEEQPASRDIMAIGSFRRNRLDFIRRLQSFNPHLEIDKYLFSTKWVFILHKTTRKKYKDVKYSDVEYKKLIPQEVVNLYSNYHAVLDIPANGQSGLSIRTFEALAMHKKLITTNTDIVSYDFYNPKNVFVLSENNIELPPKEWFCSPFSISDSILKKYSIGSWLNYLID